MKTNSKKKNIDTISLDAMKSQMASFRIEGMNIPKDRADQIRREVVREFKNGSTSSNSLTAGCRNLAAGNMNPPLDRFTCLNSPANSYKCPKDVSCIKDSRCQSKLAISSSLDSNLISALKNPRYSSSAIFSGTVSLSLFGRISSSDLGVWYFIVQ